jgi:N-methylhydantoinase B/oxoprolinase/acetone carboxylase alpha subunit
MYVSMPILKALYHVIPDRVLAEGSGAVWTIQIQGKDQNGEPFTSSMFNYSGGMGARKTKPGPSATCYPTGVAAVPVEVLEARRRNCALAPAARASRAAATGRQSRGTCARTAIGCSTPCRAARSLRRKVWGAVGLEQRANSSSTGNPSRRHASW